MIAEVTRNEKVDEIRVFRDRMLNFITQEISNPNFSKTDKKIAIVSSVYTLGTLKYPSQPKILAISSSVSSCHLLILLDIEVNPLSIFAHFRYHLSNHFPKRFHEYFSKEYLPLCEILTAFVI